MRRSGERQSNGCHGNSQDKIWDAAPRSCTTGFPVRRHDDGCAKILARHAPHHFTTPEPYNYEKNIAWFLSEGQQSIPGQSTLKQLPCNSTEGRAPSGSRGIIPRWRSTHKLKSIVVVGTQCKSFSGARLSSSLLHR